MEMVFRADASHGSGSGHVMRLSAIAEEAISRGIKCHFVGEIIGIPWLQERIENLGFESIQIDANFALAGIENILFLDSYDLSIKDPYIDEKIWGKVVVLSDTLTPKYSCSLSVHPGYSIHEKPENSKRWLAGMQYIPLRKSILKAKSTSSPGNNFRNILVFGGGTDTFDLALYLAKLISVIKGEWHFNFISNSKKSIEELDPRFEVMPFGKDLDKLVNISDLVITTASTSSLEIIAREIPLGVICVVDNQKTYYKFLTENGLAQGLGGIVESGDWQINLVKLKEILVSQSVRNQMVNRMKGLIDLHGASRIVEAVIS